MLRYNSSEQYDHWHERYAFFGDRILRKERAENISYIEHRRWDLVKRRKIFHEENVMSWWAELEKVGTFYAHEDKKIIRYIYSREHSQIGSYHTDTVDSSLPIERIRLMADNLLPLEIGKDLPKDALDVLERRLKGDEHEAVWRQDLYDWDQRNEHRSRQLYHAITLCDEAIDRYVNNKYADGLFRNHARKDLKVAINGRDYWYSLENRVIRVFRRPEGDMLIDDTWGSGS